MHVEPWKPNAVPVPVLDTMEELCRLETMKGFYLAGGTALALYLGHRISKDLDFFKDSFDEEHLLAQLQLWKMLSVTSKAPQTLHLQVGSVRISLLGYPYPLLFPPASFRAASVADRRDIACMKLAAIAGRGCKRDFIDLYMLATEFGLPSLLELFKTRFARIDYSALHTLKSLAYFEDADKEPMPNILVELSWERVKAYFVEEVRKASSWFR